MTKSSIIEHRYFTQGCYYISFKTKHVGVEIHRIKNDTKTIDKHVGKFFQPLFGEAQKIRLFS